MVLLRAALCFSAVLSKLAIAGPALELGERAPFEAFGIIDKGLAGDAAKDDYLASFAPDTLLGLKNTSQPMLKDWSMELLGRQTCDTGYWYCADFGKCCPQTSLCCSYGYCINPDDTCCPDGPCDPGWGCCGSNCYPEGGDCCSDDNYCEPGNICVRIPSENNRIVCCTDLQCTAAVVSGTTSYVSAYATATVPAASITQPPQSTFLETQSIVATYMETWYWTVTWYYYSFYWTTFEASSSSVDYTIVYSTTTFTTTASDREQAESEFSALSETLTFPVPESAHTSLEYYLTAEESSAEPSEFTFNPGAFSTGLDSTSGVNVITRTVSASSSTTSTTASGALTTGTAASSRGQGGGSVVSIKVGFAQWIMAVLGVGSGILMVVL